jgi:hypothetical protein
VSRRDEILAEKAALNDELEMLPDEDWLAEDVEGIRSDLEELTKRVSKNEEMTRITRDTVQDHYSRLERAGERMNRLEQAIYALQMGGSQNWTKWAGSTPEGTPE